MHYGLIPDFDWNFPTEDLLIGVRRCLAVKSSLGNVTAAKQKGRGRGAHSCLLLYFVTTQPCSVYGLRGGNVPSGFL